MSKRIARALKGFGVDLQDGGLLVLFQSKHPVAISAIEGKEVGRIAEAMSIQEAPQGGQPSQREAQARSIWDS